MKKIIQFGYSVRVPEGIPLVDCRSISNPYPKYAHDFAAGRHMVRNDPHFQTCVDEAYALLQSHDVIGVGCGYGVHRSGEVVREIETRADFHGHSLWVERIGKNSA